MNEQLFTAYRNAEAYNYSDSMVKNAERELAELIRNESNDSFLINMYLTTLLSKIKYCVQTSTVAYSNTIIEIVFELERIFKIDNIIDKLLGEEENQ